MSDGPGYLLGRMTERHDHESAMRFILDALTVTTLGYEEAVDIYLRARWLCQYAPVLPSATTDATDRSIAQLIERCKRRDRDIRVALEPYPLSNVAMMLDAWAGDMMELSKLAALSRSPARPPENWRVRCGSYSRNEQENEDITALRVDRGFPADDPAGCGKMVKETYAYRCTECDLWFHKGCIEKHFAVHRSSVPASSTCAWTQDDEDSEQYDTACGKRWEFNVSGPTENGVKFCPYCGRAVSVSPARRED